MVTRADVIGKEAFHKRIFLVVCKPIGANSKGCGALPPRYRSDISQKLHDTESLQA